MASFDDNILRRAIAGELGPDAPELGELGPNARERLTQLQSLVADLDRTALDMREDLAIARGEIQEPDRQLMLMALSSQAPAARGHKRRSPFPLRALIAAALVIVAVRIAWRDAMQTEVSPQYGAAADTTEEGADGTFGTRIECIEPLGQVPEWERFEWDYDLPRGGEFGLRIASVGKSRVVLSRSLTQSSWVPSPSELKLLPAGLIWEVRAFSAQGEELARGTGKARLLRR